MNIPPDYSYSVYVCGYSDSVYMWSDRGYMYVQIVCVCEWLFYVCVYVYDEYSNFVCGFSSLYVYVCAWIFVTVCVVLGDGVCMYMYGWGIRGCAVLIR